MPRCSDAPEAPAPTNILVLLDRPDWVRGFGIGSEHAARVHPARLAPLVEEDGIMTTQHLAALKPLRRTALLVTQVTSRAHKAAIRRTRSSTATGSARVLKVVPATGPVARMP